VSGRKALLVILNYISVISGQVFVISTYLLTST